MLQKHSFHNSDAFCAIRCFGPCYLNRLTYILIYTLITPVIYAVMNIYICLQINLYIFLCNISRKVSKDINRNNCINCGDSFAHHYISTPSNLHYLPKKERIPESYKVSWWYFTYLYIYSQFMIAGKTYDFIGMEFLLFCDLSFAKAYTFPINIP